MCSYTTENSGQFSLAVSFCSVRNHKPKVKMHKIDYTAVKKKIQRVDVNTMLKNAI